MAIPLVSVTTKDVAAALLDTWVSRFRVPLYVVTDRGPLFEAELFECLARMIGFHRLRTTAYNPTCNRMVRRVYRTLKTAVRSRRQEWLHALPVVPLGLRATTNESVFPLHSCTWHTGTDSEPRCPDRWCPCGPKGSSVTSLDICQH